jgi:arginyl-tRNA synthetase
VSPRNELKWQVSILPLPKTSQTESIEKFNMVQTCSNIINHQISSPHVHQIIVENCPKSTAQLSGMKIRENRKITAQGSAKNGTMKVHGHLRGSLCSDSLEP